MPIHLSFPRGMERRIRVLVVDDIAIQRMVMRRLIDSHPSLEWIGEADHGAAALELIRKEKPDALILDVQMPGMDGFDLLSRLEDPPKVVFASAWPSYAVEAFALEAVDYLLKPVSPERFASTARRLERIFNDEPTPEVRHDPMDRICLRTTERTIFLPLNGIAALEADGDFTWVKDAQQPPILACRRLGEFDELLPSPPFARLDRSLIINLDRISKIERESRNGARLWLRGLPEPIEIGRTALARVQELTKRNSI
jgi:two-component system LytT family response regulator